MNAAKQHSACQTPSGRPRFTVETKLLVAWGALVVAASVGCQPSASQGSRADLPSPATSFLPTAVPPSAPDSPVAAPAAAMEITWKDLDIGMPPETKFEPWMLTPRVKTLLNRRVRLKGYMHGGVYSAEKIRTFFLKCEVECPFGVDGQAHHHVEVELQGKLRTAYRTEPVIVEGMLTVRPFAGPDGTTWSLYHLAGTALE